MSTKKWLLVVAAAVGATALLLGNLPIAGLLPFAFLLVCPIAMLFMMKSMGGMGADHDHDAHGTAASGAPGRAASDRPADQGHQHREMSVAPTTDAQYRRWRSWDRARQAHRRTGALRARTLQRGT